MLRRIPRFLRVSIVLAVAAAIAMSIVQSWSAGLPGTLGWTQTQWGPLGPADRDLIVRVRQAGLWEQPTGQQASQQAASPEVREIGRHIASEHATLDDATRQVAGELGILLPTTPSSQQQAWMAEISSHTGTDYDRVFVQRLREAHGIVLAILADVRAGTRNSKVRAFADTGFQFVSRHIGYLESTGLVDYGALPAPPDPPMSDLIVPGLVVVATLLLAVGIVLAFRRRPARRVVGVPEVRAGPTRALPPPDLALIAMPAQRASPLDSTGPRHAVPPRARIR